MQTGNVTDAHAITSGKPTTDECTQDWTLVSAEVGTDGLVFEAERALDTGDSQDRAIVDDSEDGKPLVDSMSCEGGGEYVVVMLSNRCPSPLNHMSH